MRTTVLVFFLLLRGDAFAPSVSRGSARRALRETPSAAARPRGHLAARPLALAAASGGPIERAAAPPAPTRALLSLLWRGPALLLSLAVCAPMRALGLMSARLSRAAVGRDMWSLPIVRWAVLRTFSSWVRQCAGLTAEVDADDNGAALSGRLRAVTLAFDSLELRRGLLRTSRGAATITGLDLKLRALLLSPYRRLFQWRWLRAPIRVNGDYSLSQEDFASSKVIGNVVEKIVNALLRRLQRPILAQLRRARVLPPIGGDAAAALVLSSVERAEVTRARHAAESSRHL